MDGYVFCGLAYTQYNPRLEGERFKLDESGRLGVLAGEPWKDKLPSPNEGDEDIDVALSRVAIFEPIPPLVVEEVFEEGGENE